jgi:lysophospholipase L1-like esterase
MKKSLIYTLIFFGFCQKNKAQTTQKAFSENDRVCFVGNSITHAGYYHNFVNLYYQLHYPEMPIETFNCGVAGNSAINVIKRINVDVLNKKPTVITLMIGMNDVNRELYSTNTSDTSILNARVRSIETYKKNVDIILQSFVKNKTKIILLTPSIFDQESKIEAQNMFGVNDALGICTEYLKDLSKKYNTKIVDFNGEMNLLNRKILPQNPDFKLAGSDRIHPDIWGHFIMANIFLKTLESPKVVSLIDIDFKGKKLREKQNCEVNNLRFQKSNLSFDCLEKSLPFPIDETFKKALSYVSFEKDYNQEPLKIRNLSKGKYLLVIDGETIDTLSNDDFRNGVNLAKYQNTPQYKQSALIYKLSMERHALIANNLRDLAMFDFAELMDMKNPNDLEETKAILNKKVEDSKGKPWYDYMGMVTKQYLVNKPNESKTTLKTEELLAQIRKENKPKVHRYIVVKVD